MRALYGAETWNMGAAERKRLNVMEMRCLRNMCGVTRMERVRNEEVRRRTEGCKKSWLSEQNRECCCGLGMWKGWKKRVW